MPPLPPDEALCLILEHSAPLAVEDAPLLAAEGRALGRDLPATTDLPGFDNAAMDGYALRSADVAGASPGAPVELPVSVVIAAGAGNPAALAAGTAAKIMTGAPVPAGADAVVMREVVEEKEKSARFRGPVPAGTNVRRRGEDVRAGQPLLSAGSLVRPYEVGLLASQGYVRVPVYRRPRVAVVPTGDELVPTDRLPGPGQLRNSNGPAVAAAVARWGAEVIVFDPVPDDPARLREAFARALSEADVVLATGGVSAGDFDHTPALLKDLGLRQVFWKTAIKPGKPLLFAVGLQGRLFFGVPGNPVSALVCVEEFVRPALEKLQGQGGRPPSYHMTGRVKNGYPKEPGRRLYLFCRAAPSAQGFELDVIRPQGSAMMGMSARANALALVDVPLGAISPGQEVPFRWLK